MALRKCAGFFNNDRAANEALRRRLRESLLAHAGEYVDGVGQGGPSDQQIALAIDRGDWQTFTGASHQLLPRVWARAGIARDSEDALMYGVAWQQALCELGRDCTPDGLSYVLLCALHEQACAGSWEAFGRRGISDRQAVKVARLRSEIVAAYRRRDMAYFGLTR